MWLLMLPVCRVSHATPPVCLLRLAEPVFPKMMSRRDRSVRWPTRKSSNSVCDRTSELFTRHVVISTRRAQALYPRSSLQVLYSYYRHLPLQLQSKRVLIDLSAPFVWASQELGTLLWQQAQPFVRFYKRCEVATHHLIYKMRRLIAWIHVLSRYGMERVRGTAQEMAGWLK